jgi:cell division protein FtsI (penicillin-binding protein 3)
MTAAQMRKMMEGVVLYGTGKEAQLNGYSSGGKTGTAQKIDPVTHLYSKTMHIASFAGIAPVNNPVIAIAVVIDNPKGASYYGTAVSAPVFGEVAQQVLEYLGVPHDTDVRQQASSAKPEKPTHEDEHEDAGDINALFAAVNDLPSDDPLRAPPTPPDPQMPVAAKGKTPDKPATAAKGLGPLPEKTAPVRQATTAIVMNADKMLKVPSLVGMPMRQVIEAAAAAGLEVQVTGSGTVREQAPAAGSMVAPGTRIVVRCSR